MHAAATQALKYRSELRGRGAARILCSVALAASFLAFSAFWEGEEISRRTALRRLGTEEANRLAEELKKWNLNEFLPSDSKVGAYQSFQLQEECARRRGRANVVQDGGELGPPRPDFEGQVMYFSMGSESYIPELEVYIKTLKSLGIAENDLGIVCIDEGCAEHFKKNYDQVVVEAYIDQHKGSKCDQNEDISDMRCRVSLGKADVIIDYLRKGIAVFFFDADVMFYKHPYESIKAVNPNLPLYIQGDNRQGLNPKTPLKDISLNFGVFLAYPSTITISLFEFIRTGFDESQLWDQVLFLLFWNLGRQSNAKDRLEALGSCGDPYDYEVLPMKRYIVTHVGGYNVENTTDVVLAHATCIEGSHTKFFATNTLFGSPMPEYYATTRTVSTAESLPWDDHSKVDKIMTVLSYVAKSTGRAVRVNTPVKNSINDPKQPFAIVSAERADKAGIQLVEPQYWERAQERYGRKVEQLRVVDGLSSVGYLTPLTRLKWIAHGTEGVDADEIVFHVDDLLALDEETMKSLSEDTYVGPDGKGMSCPRDPVPCKCSDVCEGGKYRL